MCVRWSIGYSRAAVTTLTTLLWRIRKATPNAYCIPGERFIVRPLGDHRSPSLLTTVSAYVMRAPQIALSALGALSPRRAAQAWPPDSHKYLSARVALDGRRTVSDSGGRGTRITHERMTWVHRTPLLTL